MQPLISCLCVTRNRVRFLRRSVGLFQAQTYPRKELVICVEPDDKATLQYIATLRDTRITKFINSPGLTLGMRRNESLEAGWGSVLACWDDDDYHGPDRLSAQMECMQTSGKPACALSRIHLYQTSTGRAWRSHKRAWEGTIMARRPFMERYEDLPRRSDTPAIERMVARGDVALLDRPDLYTYVFHGANTWPETHLTEGTAPWCTELVGEEAEVVARTATS